MTQTKSMSGHDLSFYEGLEEEEHHHHHNLETVIKIAIAFLIILILIKLASGAVLKGSTYDISLNSLNNVIVKVNTEPSQQMIVKDGSYSFNIPQGKYNISAEYFEDNLLKYKDFKEIEIKDDGEFVYDLILFPTFDEEDTLFKDVDFSVPYDDKTINYKLIAVIIIVGIILVFGGYFLFLFYKKKGEAKEEKEGKKHETKSTKSETPETGGSTDDSDEYYTKILKIIKEQKRTTQKEIRKDIPLSEAKISLILSEMEHKGVIEKIKKGRGNIIVLKDK
ncbi:hypothetical protein HY636_02275 [Candidatus Woesearchaeota archaeon]|nr:hypothetical protein [Candidatus Woesearchaeota archaeon]